MKKISAKFKKYWETLFNAESEDGTWEITVDEKKNVKLQFWNYARHGNDGEELEDVTDLYLTKEQFESLLDFSKRMDTGVIRIATPRFSPKRKEK